MKEGWWNIFFVYVSKRMRILCFKFEFSLFDLNLKV